MGHRLVLIHTVSPLVAVFSRLVPSYYRLYSFSTFLTNRSLSLNVKAPI